MLGNGLWPSRNSVTRRKQLRKIIRRTLGTSSDNAPDVFQTLEAARALAALMDLASGERYGIAIYDFTDGSSHPIGSIVQRLTDAKKEEKRIADDLKARFSETA